MRGVFWVCVGCVGVRVCGGVGVCVERRVGCVCVCFKVTLKVNGHPEINLLKNPGYQLLLEERLTGASVMHCWGQRSCRAIPCQLDINLL